MYSLFCNNLLSRNIQLKLSLSLLLLMDSSCYPLLVDSSIMLVDSSTFLLESSSGFVGTRTRSNRCRSVPRSASIGIRVTTIFQRWQKTMMDCKASLWGWVLLRWGTHHQKNLSRLMIEVWAMTYTEADMIVNYINHHHIDHHHIIHHQVHLQFSDFLLQRGITMSHLSIQWFWIWLWRWEDVSWKAKQVR